MDVKITTGELPRLQLARYWQVGVASISLVKEKKSNETNVRLVKVIIVHFGKEKRCGLTAPGVLECNTKQGFESGVSLVELVSSAVTVS